MAKATVTANTNVVAPADAPELATKPIAAIYIGDGSYAIGIPARALTVEEWGALSVATRQSLVAQGLYRLSAGVEIPSAEEPVVPSATPMATG